MLLAQTYQNTYINSAELSGKKHKLKYKYWMQQ